MSVWKVAVAVAGSALLLSACGGSTTVGGGDSGCTAKGGDSSGGGTQTVKVVADPTTVGTYQPKNLTAKVGDKITWEWQDTSAQHSVTADDNTTFDSCLQSAGAKFTITFSKAGDFPYHCTIHSGMIGTVKVS